MSAPAAGWTLPSKGKVGMLCLIAAETCVFVIFVTAYIYYLGKSLSGPTPAQILRLPVLDTACLLSSSLTIHWAVRALQKERSRAFLLLWGLTLALGLKFIQGTASDWRRMIFQEGFTIKTSLFGTTYYSLVGLHASHVVAGLSFLSLVFLLGLTGRVRPRDTERCEVLSYYWHFVDAVWVVVFTVVYVAGR